MKSEIEIKFLGKIAKIAYDISNVLSSNITVFAKGEALQKLALLDTK